MTPRATATLLFAIAAALASRAAAPSAGSQREALIECKDLRPWVIGADVVLLRRDVDTEGFPGRLEATLVGGFVGFRPMRWLTLYGTLARATADIGIDDLDDGIAGSIGLHANLSSHDLSDPEFLSGRWSLRLGAEYEQADLDAGEWRTIAASAVVHWEIFAESPRATERSPFSFALYAGPLFSNLDGKIKTMPVHEDFDGVADWGVTVGMEVHLSHNFLLAAGVEFIEGTSWLISLRQTF